MLHEFVTEKVFCLMLLFSSMAFNANTVNYNTLGSSPVTSMSNGITSNWATGPPSPSGPSFNAPTKSSRDDDEVHFNAGVTHSGYSTLADLLPRLTL